MSDEAAAPAQMVNGSKLTLYGRGHQIMLDVWRGTVYLKVNKDKAWVFNKKLTLDGLEVFRQELVKLKDAAPGAVRTLTVSEYNRDTKKFVRSYVIKFTKSDSLVYGIEVMDEKGSYAAPFMIASTLSLGTDPMQERDRSAIALERAINQLKYEFSLSVMMTAAARPVFNRNDRGGGSSGGNSPTPAAPSNGAGWDDAPAE